jgi:hypothetical protein
MKMGGSEAITFQLPNDLQIVAPALGVGRSPQRSRRSIAPPVLFTESDRIPSNLFLARGGWQREHIGDGLGSSVVFFK